MKDTNELILTIDAGTQSIRAALVDLTGQIINLVKTPIEPYFSEFPGWAEQKPEYYWEMLCRSCQNLFKESEALRSNIIGCCKFCPGGVLDHTEYRHKGGSFLMSILLREEYPGKLFQVICAIDSIFSYFDFC